MNHLKEQLAEFLERLKAWLAGLAGPTLQPQPIPVKPPQRDRDRDAFTMIEIAISLAVIGFALVAIIGILPTAMSVQKDNREETIINQDASVFINAIRNGQRGIDDLTNYVMAITNFTKELPDGRSLVLGYTFTNSTIDAVISSPQYPITNGLRIVGLLSTPRYDGFRSNYVVAYVRSMSGLASEKFPQNNPEVMDFALGYRLLMEVLPAGNHSYHWTWTNFTESGISTNEMILRSNLWARALNSQTNYHDLRLIFRYPFIASRTGKGRQVFRTALSGRLISTNEPNFLNLEHRLFFFEPGEYVEVAKP